MSERWLVLAGLIGIFLGVVLACIFGDRNDK